MQLVYLKNKNVYSNKICVDVCVVIIVFFVDKILFKIIDLV